MDKEFIANVSKFESYFRVVHHGCICITMGNQQYALNYQIIFSVHRNLFAHQSIQSTFRMEILTFPVSVSDQQYRKNPQLPYG